jgi:hypothetical protein
MNSSEIQKHLDENRYETVRRLCRRELNSCTGTSRNEWLFLLHRACRLLGDPIACREALAQVVPRDEDEELDVVLRQAEDARRFAVGTFYNDSEAYQQGLSQREYFEIMRNKVKELLKTAEGLAQTDAQKERLSASRTICEESQFSYHSKSVNNVVPPPSPVRTGTCGLRGRITFADGTPARNLPLTLGLEVAHLPHDSRRYTNTNLEVYEPAHSPIETVACVTDEDGGYAFDNLPAGTHEFLSVNLDPQKYPIAVRFVAQKIVLTDSETRTLNTTIKDWRSAPSRMPQASLPETQDRDGKRLNLVAIDKLCNPFAHHFPRQLVELTLPKHFKADPERLMLISSDEPEKPLPFQVSGERVFYFTDLPANHDRFVGFYQAEALVSSAFSSALVLAEEGNTLVVSTGKASFRLPTGEGTDPLPPIIQVKGIDNAWRGQGRLVLPDEVRLRKRKTTILDQGPLCLKLSVDYELSSGLSYSFILTFHENEEYVLAHEVSPKLDGAGFIFSLKEFLPGRTLSHGGPRRWEPMLPGDKQLGHIKETMSFGVPTEALGQILSPDSLDQKDCVGVFSIRRGEWIDREFERISQGPAVAGYSHEQEWPYPEMIGSSISMITAETKGDDCFFRFGCFDGERHWGMMVSSFEKNDGAWPTMADNQMKNSSPRLQDFKGWQLDVQTETPRPALMIKAEELPALRRRRDDERFRRVWQIIENERPNGGGQWGPNCAGAFRAILSADPVQVWNKKCELAAVAGPHAQSVLKGRQMTPEYSPVASRCVTPWIEDYDLIAATGVFSDAEEQRIRAHHMLMGHMYLEPDFMNWKHGARNANFESDRVDTVGAVGICFQETRDGKTFVAHAKSRIAKIIDTYCTPGSGKWYENPACYYLTSLNCWTTLFVHLQHHGLISIDEVPRLKEFMRWGVLLLTPPTPGYSGMRDGLAPEAYEVAEKKRRIAPIGDHAHLGPSIIDNVAILAECYKAIDPEYADLLRWAYHEAGADGAYHGNPMLLFIHGNDWVLRKPDTEPELPSRRLEGFGAVLRSQQNQPDESYLLLKLGPGGYRYHNTEGSIIFFANGKPLIYDGGEAGETWRHSTLSFYANHAMLAPGHVERFFDSDSFGFTQGVSPKVLKPGEANYLNDRCRPEDAETGYRNYHEPKPANSRSLFWAKDEYLLIHDALDIAADIPSHWHLQVVGDAHVGNVNSGWRFKGRFGTDLQVVLVDHDDAVVRIEQKSILEAHRPPEECFSMRHLQVTGRKGTAGYLAVLRPLAKGRSEIQAASLSSDGRTIGAQVSGDAINDTLYFSRELFAHQQGEIGFRGKFAAVLRRADSVTLNLFDGESLACGNLSISSTGPAVSVHQSRQGTRIAAKGKGSFGIKEGGKTRLFEVNGEFKEDTDAGSSTSIPS